MMSIGWVGRTGWYFQSNIRRQKMSLSISGGSGGGLDLLKGLLASIKASQTASNQTSSSDTTKSTATTSKTNTTTTTDSGSQSDSNGLTAFSDALKNLLLELQSSQTQDSPQSGKAPPPPPPGTPYGRLIGPPRSGRHAVGFSEFRYEFDILVNRLGARP